MSPLTGYEHGHRRIEDASSKEQGRPLVQGDLLIEWRGRAVAMIEVFGARREGDTAKEVGSDNYVKQESHQCTLLLAAGDDLLADVLEVTRWGR